MKLRHLLAMLAIAAMTALATGTASAQTITYRAGPFHVGGFQTTLPKLQVRAPHMDGYITKMNATLHYANGRRVSIRRVMLHHIVFLNDGTPNNEPGGSCKGRKGEPFYGTGEEREQLLLPKGLRVPGPRERPLADADDADEPQLPGPQRVRAVHVQLHQAAQDAGAAVLDPRQRLQDRAAELLGADAVERARPPHVPLDGADERPHRRRGRSPAWWRRAHEPHAAGMRTASCWTPTRCSDRATTSSTASGRSSTSRVRSARASSSRRPASRCAGARSSTCRPTTTRVTRAPG